MKQMVAVFLSLAIILSIVACGNANSGDTSDQVSISTDDMSNSVSDDSSVDTGDLQDDTSEGTNSENDTVSVEANNDEQGSNILVAYFSRVGNTDWEDGVDAVTSASLNLENGEYVGNAELLAQMAQEATGGDLFLIETVESYPSDYRATTDQAAVEQNEDARPALASHVENMDSYDVVILIYPNWWGTLPQPLFTFLEEYDFSGKTILPLCTHAGSRMGSSERDIAALCPDAILLDGLAVPGSSAASAQSDVEAWINQSGILK